MKRWIPLLLIAGLAGFGWWLRPEPAAPPEADTAAPFEDEFTVAASQDTFVALGIDDPVGHLGQLQAGFDAVEHWTYIQWDLPEDLGADAVVTHVEIRLYCTNIKVSNPAPPQRVIEGGIPNRGWREDTLTWRTKTGKVGPLWRWEPGDCDTENANGEWKTMSSDENDELLEIVQGWIEEPDDNNGIMLVPLNTNPDFELLWDFRSGDNELPPPLGKGPRLTFRVEGAATPTFTPSITPTPSDTPTPTNTFTPTATFTPSATPTPTFTPSPTATPTATPTPRSIYAPIVMKNYDAEVGQPTDEPSEPTPTPDPAETPEPSATPEPDVEIEIQELDGSGVEGSAALWQIGDDVEVAVGAAPMLGDAHPVMIHDADSCDELDEMLYELSDLVDGSSMTTLEDTMLESVADGDNAVVIFASSDDMTPVACGILPEYMP